MELSRRASPRRTAPPLPSRRGSQTASCARRWHVPSHRRRGSGARKDVIVDERLISSTSVARGRRRRRSSSRDSHFPWQIVDGRSVAASGRRDVQATHRARQSLRGLRGQAARKRRPASRTGILVAVFAAVYHEPVELFWDRVIPNVSSQVFVTNSAGSRFRRQASRPGYTAGLTPTSFTTP